MISTGKIYPNEIAKEIDSTYAFRSSIENLAIFARFFMDDSSKNVLLGGKVSADPIGSLNVYIEPLCACNSAGVFTGEQEKAGPIPITVSDPSRSRIDIVQIQGIYEDYDEQQRAFNDPNTNAKTYDNVFTKTRFITAYNVKAGTAGDILYPMSRPDFKNHHDTLFSPCTIILPKVAPYTSHGY